MLRSLILLLAVLAAPALAFAQDADGNDTAGNWRIDHHKAFGLWDSMCDWRGEGAGREQRCYLRYVDVFAPRPKFAAVFVFITPEKTGPRVAFGIEAGTQYKARGLRVDGADGPVWVLADLACTRTGECVFEGADAAPLLTALNTGAGHSLRQAFFDPHGRAQDLAWDLSQFPAAFADFQTQSRARGLPE